MSIPGLTGYAGPKLPAAVERLLSALHAAGLTFTPSGDKKKTIRVQRDSVYVAYFNGFVLSHGAVLGYRFNEPLRKPSNACSANFDVRAFAKGNGLSPTALDVQVSSGKTYLHILSAEAAVSLLTRAWAGAPSGGISSFHPDATIADDIASIAADDTLNATTRAALIQARVGQGAFRASLIKRFEGKCAVTRLGVSRLLCASHILPWRDADNKERLDPDNGLLLSPTANALFDAGLITFDHEGRVRHSHELDAHSLECLGAVGDLCSPPTPGQARYLRLHADEVFIKRTDSLS